MRTALAGCRSTPRTSHAAPFLGAEGIAGARRRRRAIPRRRAGEAAERDQRGQRAPPRSPPWSTPS
eukprot:4309162-Pyramimonas_sp.AAC.1